MGKKRALFWGLMATMILLLSGCFFRSADGKTLYQLPERSAGYENLDKTIKEVRSYLETQNGSSSEYAVIFSGENTSTIQLQDFDGDGTRETAITFLRLPEAEKPIKICLFTREEEIFRFSGLIEGDGAAIYAVDYADMAGDGDKEVVVSWQTGNGLYQLGVYSLAAQMTQPAAAEETDTAATQSVPKFPHTEKLLATQLLLTSYNRYCIQDINQDGRMELIVLRLGQTEGSRAEVYGGKSGALANLDNVTLSSGITSLNSVKGNFVDGKKPIPALYICSTLASGDSAVDILAYRDNKLTNLTLEDNGLSRERGENLSQTDLEDIDNDGILEIPVQTPLAFSTDSEEERFCLLEWKKYKVNGSCELVSTTYHNWTDGWYLVIPENWKERLVISRNDQEVSRREVVFSRWMGEKQLPVQFMTIYKLTGPNRSMWANMAGRSILREEDDTIYAVKLLTNSWNCGLDADELKANFHMISEG